MRTLPIPNSPRIGRYLFAIAAVVIASFLRQIFASVLGDSVPFIFFYPAVALAAWFGGFWSGVLSTMLAGLSAWYIFIPTYFSFRGLDTETVVQLMIFFPASAFICLLAESLHQTTRRAQEGELREREQHRQYRVTLSSIGDAVIATDAKGQITFMNPIAESLTGWSYNEAAGKPINEVFQAIDEESRHPISNPALQALDNGLIVALANDAVLIAKDGTERAIDDSAAPIHDDEGAIAGIVSVFRDISERRRIQKIEALLAAIVESSDDAILSKDLNGQITTWNAGAERLFGYRADEAIGQPITKLIVPPERIEEETEILRRIRNGEILNQYETEQTRKDGTPVEVSLTVSPVRSADSTIVGASEIARDITKRRTMEQRLRESDRQKDNFIAILAHELRNPLSPIQNTVQVLQLERPDDRELLHYCDLIEKETIQINHLLGDLLDTSRITQGKLSLHKERINSMVALNRAIETSRPAFGETGHKLTVDVISEQLVVDADPVRLTQVFSNLLNNAAKFTESKGHIRVTAECQGNQAVVRIKDSGIGIDPELMPKIFDMFVQGEGITNRRHGGLGLGLTLARDIIQLHGGSIEAKSDGLGKGSEFIVSLPLSTPLQPLEYGHAVAAKIAATTAPRRIMIVDDSKNQVLSLERLLKRIGHDVRVAYDAAGAVQVMEDFLPDFALIDIGLPGVNGYDLARQLRDRPRFCNVTLIAQTGWGREEDLNEARAAGFDHHFVKPIDHQRLAEILANPASR